MRTSTFQFTNPKIVQLKYSINDDFDSKEEKVQLNNNFSVSIKDTSYEDMHATVSLKTEIGEESTNQPFYLLIEISAKFYSTEKLSSEEFDKYLNINAPALLLSYSRPMVSLITTQAGLSTLNLPFVNFTVD
ncbi:MAG: protein-export chaperone SecB [Clostridiales bacterium]|nr:protein-export chaperone SecB [Clostridiales bacterium]